VKYAKDRFVNIMPEVDVPGHSLAAVVAYPELSATAGADKYVVRSGERIMDWSKPGHPALVDNTLNPAGEFTYTVFRQGNWRDSSNCSLSLYTYGWR
jgi:hexosaminidase